MANFNMNEDLIKKIVKELREAIESDDSNVVTDTEIWAEQVLETAISKAKEEAIKQNESVRNKLIDMYIEHKGESIPNELADLALKLIEKQARKEEREKVVKEIKDFVGDPGEVNGPWFLPVKTLFTFLDKLLTQKK